MPRTVWVANDAGHDTSDAERFGEVKPLTLGTVNPLQLDRLNYHIARGIAKYVQPDDYLLISGTPMVSSSALLIWILFHNKCNLLQWNAKRRKYSQYTLTLEQIRNLLDKALIT